MIAATSRRFREVSQSRGPVPPEFDTVVISVAVPELQGWVAFGKALPGPG